MMKLAAKTLLSVLLFLGFAACQPHYQNTDRSSMNKIPLRPTCVGRHIINLPTDAPQGWTQQYGNYLRIERLPYSINTLERFTALIEQRRNELASAPHDTEGHLLSEYKQTSPDSWLLLSRDSAVDVYTYNIERYIWTGHWGYRFTKGIATKGRSLIDADPDPVKDLLPIDNVNPPSQVGFCIQDAMMNGPPDRGMATVSVDVPGWRKATLVARVSEHGKEPEPDDLDRKNSSPPNRTFSFLDRDKFVFDSVRKMSFSDKASEGQMPTVFEVLRRRERLIDGRQGQEAVWKTVDRRGDVVYRFEWDSIDELQNRNLPALVVRMNIGSYQEQDVIPTPPEGDLFALWDAVLATLHKR
jgi:hypothetical protein